MDVLPRKPRGDRKVSGITGYFLSNRNFCPFEHTICQDQDQHCFGYRQNAHRKVLFGLPIAPERLQQIRQQRRADSEYASLARCRQEAHWAERLYAAHGIPFLNTTAMSIEGIAAAIMHRTGIRRRAF